MRTDCLLEVIDAARGSWEYVISLVPEDKREWRLAPDAWSLKDIIAHVAWHDDRMVELAETKDLVESPWWELSNDERNRRIHELYRDTPIDEVLALAEDAFARMISALGTLTDEDMNDPKRYTNVPEDWIPWRVFGNNTYEHYLRHIGQIRKLAKECAA